jgi:hypothetical protein
LVKQLNRKYLATGLAIGLIIGVAAVFLVPPLLPQSFTSLLPKQNPSNLNVTVAAGKVESVNFEGVKYEFKYQPASSNPKATFSVIAPLTDYQPSIYDAQTGAVVETSGLKITVLDIQSNYINLNIKARIP